MNDEDADEDLKRAIELSKLEAAGNDYTYNDAINAASNYSSHEFVRLDSLQIFEDCNNWPQAYTLCSWRPKEKDIWIDDFVLKKIAALNCLLDVVSAVGPYRSGKSYLLSHIANNPGVFTVGDTQAACTKGIIAYLTRHPKQPDRHILFLDTEGLGDARKAAEREDSQLLLVCILLSTLLIYNIQQKITRLDIQQLLISEQSRRAVKVEGNQPPTLLVLIRDFALKKIMPDDDYLSECLQAQSGAKDDEADFFSERLCITMPTPAYQIDDLDKREKNPEFVRKVNDVREFVLDSWETTECARKKKMTTKLFVFLLRRCVNDINKKLIPDVANAYEAFLERQCEDLARSLMEQYKTFLTSITKPIWPTKLEDLNNKKLSILQQQYYESAIGSSDQQKKSWLKFLDKLDRKYKDFQLDNDNAFANELTKAYKTALSKIMKKYENKTYFGATGMEAFQSDCDEVRSVIENFKCPQTTKDKLLNECVEAELQQLAALITDVFSAQEDAKNKDKMYKSEIQKLQLDAEEKVAQQRRQLDQSIEEHNRKIDEIQKRADLTKEQMEQQKRMLEDRLEDQRNSFDNVKKNMEAELSRQRAEYDQRSREERQRLDQLIKDQHTALRDQQSEMVKATKEAMDREEKLRAKYMKREEEAHKKQEELLEKQMMADREHAKEIKEVYDKVRSDIDKMEASHRKEIEDLRSKNQNAAIFGNIVKMASCIVPLVVPGGKIAALASAGLGALMSLASEADSNPPTTSSTSRDEMDCPPASSANEKLTDEERKIT